MATSKATVAYVVAEGGGGVRARLAVLRDAYGPAPDFHVLISPVDLFRPDADLVPLIAALKAIGGVGLVGIDTLSRVLAGGDENSSVDMGTLVKNLDRLRAEVQAHVLVVHHTGKDAARGARGHSLLRAATDTEIEVAATDRGCGTVRDTKQRDLPGGWSRDFRLVDRVIGVDDRGKVVSSALVVIEEEQASSHARIDPSPLEARVLECVHLHDDGRGVKPGVLKGAGLGANAASVEATVRRLAGGEGRGKGLLVKDERGAYRLSARGAAWMRQQASVGDQDAEKAAAGDTAALGLVEVDGGVFG